MLGDMRHATRRLWKTLGLGANSAIFSVIDAVLLASYVPARRAAKVDPWSRCATSEVNGGNADTRHSH